MNEKQVTTRNPRQCFWCGVVIPKGSKAEYSVEPHEGSMASFWMHPECLEAMGKSECPVDGFVEFDQDRGVLCNYDD